MAKKGQRELLALVCSVCKNQNYITEKNKTNTTGKLVLKKYCKKCKKKTEHKESSKLK
jgi:large subunit ribosomal protein L33